MAADLYPYEFRFIASELLLGVLVAGSDFVFLRDNLFFRLPKTPVLRCSMTILWFNDAVVEGIELAQKEDVECNWNKGVVMLQGANKIYMTVCIKSDHADVKT